MANSKYPSILNDFAKTLGYSAKRSLDDTVNRVRNSVNSALTKGYESEKIDAMAAFTKHAASGLLDILDKCSITPIHNNFGWLASRYGNALDCGADYPSNGFFYSSCRDGITGIELTIDPAEPRFDYLVRRYEWALSNGVCPSPHKYSVRFEDNDHGDDGVTRMMILEVRK